MSVSWIPRRECGRGLFQRNSIAVSLSGIDCLFLPSCNLPVSSAGRVVVQVGSYGCKPGGTALIQNSLRPPNETDWIGVSGSSIGSKCKSNVTSFPAQPWRNFARRIASSHRLRKHVLRPSKLSCVHRFDLRRRSRRRHNDVCRDRSLNSSLFRQGRIFR